MDIPLLKTEDDVLLFCVRTKARSLAAVALKCRVSVEYVRQYFIGKGISFAEVKKHLKRIDFIDYHPWWKDQYVFEEGEEARHYLGNYWITNYGTVLAKRKRAFGGHTFEKLIKLSPRLVDGGYQQIGLSILDGNQRSVKEVYVHKMVGEVWLTKPVDGLYVKHKHGNTLDNHFWNLIWA